MSKYCIYYYALQIAAGDGCMLWRIILNLNNIIMITVCIIIPVNRYDDNQVNIMITMA